MATVPFDETISCVFTFTIPRSLKPYPIHGLIDVRYVLCGEQISKYIGILLFWWIFIQILSWSNSSPTYARISIFKALFIMFSFICCFTILNSKDTFLVAFEAVKFEFQNVVLNFFKFSVANKFNNFIRDNIIHTLRYGIHRFSKKFTFHLNCCPNDLSNNSTISQSVIFIIMTLTPVTVFLILILAKVFRTSILIAGRCLRSRHLINLSKDNLEL